MPMTCSVLGCTARFQNKELNPLRTFHSFPKDEALRRTWLRAIQREDFVPTKYSRLCSDHFREESFDRTSLHYVRLRDGAIPSIFTTVQESLKRKKRQKRKIPKKHEKKQKKKKPRKHDVKVSRPQRTISGSHCLTGELPEPASLVRSEPELPCSLEEGKVKEDLLGMETDEDSLAASDHGLAECVIEKPCILEEVYIKEEPIDESGFETSPHLRTAESNRKQKSSTHDTMEFSSTHEVKEEPLSTEDNKDSFVAKCIKKEACIKEELIIKEEPMDESNMEISPVLRNTVSFTSDGRQPNSSEKETLVKRKQKYLRDQFALELGKIPPAQSGDATGDTPRSKWQHFKLLHSLKDIVKPRASTGNLSGVLTSDIVETSLPESPQVEYQTSTVEPPWATEEGALASSSHTQDTPECGDKVMEKQGLTLPSTRQKKKGASKRSKTYDYNQSILDIERQKIQYLKEKSNQKEDREDDEDLMFFKSLLPHVKRIPAMQKLTFRSRLQELVQQFA